MVTGSLGTTPITVGNTGTSTTGILTINTASTSAANAVGLYNATSSSTGQIASITLATVQTLYYDAVLPNGLFVRSTTSTGDLTITWA